MSLSFLCCHFANFNEKEMKELNWYTIIIHWLVERCYKNFPRFFFSLCYYASKKLQGDIPFKNVKNIRWIDSRGIFKYNGNDGDAANMINEIWSAMVGEYIQNNVGAFKWYKQIKITINI